MGTNSDRKLVIKKIRKQNKGRKRRKKSLLTYILRLLIIFVFLAILIFFIKANFDAKNRSYPMRDFEDVYQSFKELSIEDVFKNIKPVKMKETKATEVNKQEDKNELKKQVKDRKVGELDANIKTFLRYKGIDFSQVSYVYYNFSNGMFSAMNEDEPFLAASTSKLPINVFAYDLAFNEGLNLQDSLSIYEGAMEGGTGVLQGEEIGSTYTIQELLSLMIRESDNVATNMIYGYLGGINGEYLLDSLNRIYGMASDNGNYMTANNALYFLKKIYYNEDNNPYYATLIDDLKHTVYNEYFTRDFQSDRIAHKTGDFDGYYNDIGIVYGDEDYAFAVYTNNLPEGETTIGDIGKIMNDWHDGK